MAFRNKQNWIYPIWRVNILSISDLIFVASCLKEHVLVSFLLFSCSEDYEGKLGHLSSSVSKTVKNELQNAGLKHEIE